MPLNTIALKNAMKSEMLANLPTPSSSQITEVDTLCGAIASAMQTFVTGATITYSTGLIAPSGGGPVTGIFTNTIT